MQSTYHELAKKRLNTNNPPTGFVEMAINVSNIPIDLLAFYPMLRFHFEYSAIVADTPDYTYRLYEFHSTVMVLELGQI